jgi:hypothetical protein
MNLTFKVFVKNKPTILAINLPSDFQRILHYETTTGGISFNLIKIYVADCSQAMEPPS